MTVPLLDMEPRDGSAGTLTGSSCSSLVCKGENLTWLSHLQTGVLHRWDKDEASAPPSGNTQCTTQRHMQWGSICLTNTLNQKSVQWTTEIKGVWPFNKRAIKRLVAVAGLLLSRLASSWSHGYPWPPGPLASTSWVLGLQACAPTPVLRLGIEPRDLYMLGKYSANWVASSNL